VGYRNPSHCGIIAFEPTDKGEVGSSTLPRPTSFGRRGRLRLGKLLRAKETQTLILFGIATSGVVLTTLRDAVGADYRLIVVNDCCADADPDVSRFLVERSSSHVWRLWRTRG